MSNTLEATKVQRMSSITVERKVITIQSRTLMWALVGTFVSGFALANWAEATAIKPATADTGQVVTTTTQPKPPSK